MSFPRHLASFCLASELDENWLPKWSMEGGPGHTQERLREAGGKSARGSRARAVHPWKDERHRHSTWGLCAWLPVSPF